MKNIFILSMLVSLYNISFSQSPAQDSLILVSPLPRIVYQRDNNNTAVVHIKGTCPLQSTLIEARLKARVDGQGVSTKWKKVDSHPSGGKFEGIFTGEAGWYDLEVCARNKNTILKTAVVERVGIGEVFIIVGHSVAQGGTFNLAGAADDRVSVIPLEEKSETFDKFYLKTGDMKYLPEPHFVQAGDMITPAPFGHGTYFWSKFAEKVAKKENVPVLIYNAAFGGTNLEHWSKATQNIQFEHGFVRSNIRMPYINLYNTLKKYIPLTGLRAILADHGQNDAGEKDPDKIFRNYQIVMKQTRDDLGYPELALVVNRQTPKNAPAVLTAQIRMSKEPYCFPGPQYDSVMLKEDRYDGIHLSESGLVKAADLWAEALSPAFFRESRPWLPSFTVKGR